MRWRSSERGGALLAVLWLSVAMTAIAFALSRGVRAELDRASLNVDSTKAYFLAQGAIEATMRRIARPVDPQNPERNFEAGLRFVRYDFPTGTVDVEITGESGKLDVNTATAEALARAFDAARIDPATAVNLAAGIVDYRERLRQGLVSYGMTPDELMAQAGESGAESSFRARVASIQELEELLSVPGMSPELYYGGYRETPDGELLRVAGLRELLTVRGMGVVDVRYAPAPLLLAAGLSPSAVEQVEEIRRLRPLGPDDPVVASLSDLPGPIRLGLGAGSPAYTLAATATLKNGRAKRSVAALVERAAVSGPDPIRVVRWFDSAF
jgi:general secretion pathway protein K